MNNFTAPCAFAGRNKRVYLCFFLGMANSTTHRLFFFYVFNFLMFFGLFFYFFMLTWQLIWGYFFPLLFNFLYLIDLTYLFRKRWRLNHKLSIDNIHYCKIRCCKSKDVTIHQFLTHVIWISLSWIHSKIGYCFLILNLVQWINSENISGILEVILAVKLTKTGKVIWGFFFSNLKIVLIISLISIEFGMIAQFGFPVSPPS